MVLTEKPENFVLASARYSVKISWFILGDKSENSGSFSEAEQNGLSHSTIIYEL